MSFSSILCIFGLFVATHASKPVTSGPKNFSNIDIAEEMKKAGIVPKVIPKAPTELLNVILTGGDLIPGSIVFFDDDEHFPSIDYKINNTKWHTLIVTAIQNWDPDEKLVSRYPNSTSPAHPQEENVRWVLSNIRGNAALYGDEYYKRNPPLVEGDTQIVNLELYLLYEQPGKLKQLKNRSPVSLEAAEAIGSVREFAAKHNLLGPVAGNFFYRRWQRLIQYVHSQYF